MDSLKNRQHIRILFPRTTETWNYPSLTLQSYACVALYRMWKILLFPSKLDIFGSPQGPKASWPPGVVLAPNMETSGWASPWPILGYSAANGKSDYSDIFPAKIKRYLAYTLIYVNLCFESSGFQTENPKTHDWNFRWYGSVFHLGLPNEWVNPICGRRVFPALDHCRHRVFSVQRLHENHPNLYPTTPRNVISSRNVISRWFVGLGVPQCKNGLVSENEMINNIKQ